LNRTRYDPFIQPRHRPQLRDTQRERGPDRHETTHRRRLDRVELATLALFALVSLWVLGLDLWQVAVHGRVWTGTDGVYDVDQLQYLAWIRDASQNVLVGNHFVLRATPSDYFQPAVVISGALSAVGVAPWLALLLWKPVAVGGSFYAVRAYVRRQIPGRSARHAGLILALFFGSITVVYGSAGVLGDLFPTFLSWGYVFGLLALAAVLAALVLYDRARRADRTSWTAGLLGAAAGLLHPWHGELLILIVLGAELTLVRRSSWHPRALLRPAPTLILTAAPLIYYGVLGRTDLSWELARGASKHGYPLWSILLALAPLLPAAAYAYRRPARSFLGAATRTWPLAAVALYLVSSTALGATPLHAFEGITVPLAVLAVEGVQLAGWSRLRHRFALALLALGVLTIPATALELKTARDLVKPRAGTANFIAPGEQRALTYLSADHTSGGVLSRSYLGLLVPEATGRHTFVGDCIWSEPDCGARLLAVRRLFTGAMTPEAAERFVRSTGARFLLSDCRNPQGLSRTLGPLLASVKRFGCASVYEVR
jgi:hypothetical protein